LAATEKEMPKMDGWTFEMPVDPSTIGTAQQKRFDPRTRRFFTDKKVAAEDCFLTGKIGFADHLFGIRSHRACAPKRPDAENSRRRQHDLSGIHCKNLRDYC
jgi:hypothetical protein